MLTIVKDGPDSHGCPSKLVVDERGNYYLIYYHDSSALAWFACGTKNDRLWPNPHYVPNTSASSLDECIRKLETYVTRNQAYPELLSHG